MEKGSRLDLLEDSRFKEIKRLKKKHLPHKLHWYLTEDYFSEELLGIYSAEVERMRRLAQDAFFIFEKATKKILEERKLHELGIPSFFEECIQYSWEHRKKHPFLYGRFDINGGVKNDYGRIIEFNADTCSTLPETLLWQPLQLKQLKGTQRDFNTLERDISSTLGQLKYGLGNPNPVLLASSFGYVEDINNVSCVLDIGYEAGFKPVYKDLEKVVFSEDGIFHPVGDEYEQVDVWFKMIPWDWMFNEEPELAKLLSDIIINNKAVVLNPSYTAIWQNKKFLAYITKYFPNNAIAETYLQQDSILSDYVVKPVYGRLGENITIQQKGESSQSKGDFGMQDKVYQKYYPLTKDEEDYWYQFGMFHTKTPSALNVRTQQSRIITDDCEFMSHFII